VRALITGGCGFIGSHLAEALLARGDAVTVVDNLSTGRFENIAALVDRPGFQFVIENITNEPVMDRLVSECDLVCHLAAAVGVETEWVQVVCSDPSLHRRRLEQRTPVHPGLAEPSWDAVAARATGFDGWDDERLVVDAIDPLEVVVDRVLDHLTAR